MTSLSHVAVDYEFGAGQTAADYPTLEEKLEVAADVTRTALEQYERPAVMWTGGKDSTLVLYVVREVAADLGVPVPPVVYIEHFEGLDDVRHFVDHWVDEWDLDLVVARNEDFFEHGWAFGDEVRVDELNEQNRRELDRIEFEGETMVVDPDSFEGNHLLKTIALNNAIVEYDFDGVFSGVRWDEQASRAKETFFSPRHDAEKYPPHDRVNPILQFTEADLWEAFWHFVVPDSVDEFPAGHAPQSRTDLPDGVALDDIPVPEKYFEGFRSLGTETGSKRSDDRPAWVQDLEHTTERAGRAQDKENLMERLRDLGYM
ncbi:phosphoadenosine phosphosulfate reductase family protein [Salinigranum halophilum]|uniref:phosphoadenosine phosphosulfate reductase family protein n=1 Tax=Salinigranum halophilum TaxID=2565931 RepID=UPI0010A8BB6D|nr:phosphoadenosine phosphosulfate reductase family protein [Salinigranum halophilum]